MSACEFPSEATRPVRLPTQSLCQGLSYHIPLAHPHPEKTSTNPLTRDHHHLVAWRLTEGMERTRTAQEKNTGGRLWMRRGDVKVVRGQPGAATICGYIFSPEPLNVQLALGLSTAFWCG